MAKTKATRLPPSNTEIRSVMLQYFYDRNKNATSARGKKGSAVKISDVKNELKAANGLTQPKYRATLPTSLAKAGSKRTRIEKSFTAPGGTVIPSSTSFYKITAAGIDKIEGPGEFTMSKFHGIKIEATGQNIITLGDGNQVNAKFGDLGESWSSSVTRSRSPKHQNAQKMDLVADIDTIQSQLAKPDPIAESSKPPGKRSREQPLSTAA